MHQSHRFLPLVTALLAFSGNALANETILLSESDFFVDIPEVTSATRMPQKLSEAPASMTVIDRTMIEASGLQTIPDLLRLVPGFQSYSINANTLGTTYHGASDDFPNRLEVMVDGRSVYLPLLSTVAWNTLGISLDDIERIEVVRGSNVPAQGSNAFFGSIDIITREPTASSGLNLGTLFGSQNTRNAHLSYADSNDLVSYRISASHEQNDGNAHYSTFYTGDWFAADGSDGHWQDDLSRDYLNLSTTWTPDLTNSFWLQFGVDRGHKTTGALDLVDHHFDEREHDSLFLNGKYSRLYSDTGTLQLTAYHNRLELETPRAPVNEALAEFGSNPAADCSVPGSLEDLDTLMCLFGIPFSERSALAQALVDQNSFHMLGEHGRTQTSDIELQLNDRIGRLSFAAGLGYRYMKAESEVLLQGGAVNEERSRAFSTLNFDLNSQWQLVTGFMYEYSSEYTEAFSYRNALIYKPDRGSSWRLGYSSSERLPSLLERYSESTIYIPAFAGYIPTAIEFDQDAGPSPSLEEEKISSWELGFYQALPAQTGYADIRIFREQVTDAIFSYWDPLPGHPYDTRIRRSKNVGSWQNEGIEMQLKYQPTPTWWTLLTYGYINTINDEWAEGTDKGIFKMDPSMTPLHTASWLVSWSVRPDLQLSFTQYYMDEVDWLEGGLREHYSRTDLRAAKQWQLDNGTELQAALIVQNAFDPAYSDFYEYNEFDRRTYLQLNLTFD